MPDMRYWFVDDQGLRAISLDVTGAESSEVFNVAEELATQMRRILQMKDDYNNRARRVHFDGRRFGPGWSTLPKSKATFGF